MKNGRHGNNDSKRRSSSTATGSRQSVTDGRNIRTNDGNESSISGESESVRIENRSTDGYNPNESRGNAKLTLADGYYFAPDGTVTAIPDGHYIHNGRLRKRRQSRNNSGNSTDGNENRNRTETGNEQILDSEIPLRKVKVGRKKKVTETQQRLTMITMLTVALSATFTSIALLTKHKHWSLESAEIDPFAEALNDALATLPTKSYEFIIAIIEKWVPWVNLIFVASAIIIPRIEESIKQIERSRYQQNPGVNERPTGTKDYHWPNEASFGFNE